MEGGGEGLNQPVGSSPQKLERRIRDFESQGGVIVGGDSERETPTPEGNRRTTMEADPNNPPAHQGNEFLLSQLPEGPVTAENARKALEALASINAEPVFEQYLAQIKRSVYIQSMSESGARRKAENALRAKEKLLKELNLGRMIADLSESDNPTSKALGLELQIMLDGMISSEQRDEISLKELTNTRQELRDSDDKEIPGQIHGAVEVIFGEQEEGDNRTLQEFAKDKLIPVFTDETARKKLVNNMISKKIISNKEAKKYNKMLAFDAEWKSLGQKAEGYVLVAVLSMLALLVAAKQKEN